MAKKVLTIEYADEFPPELQALAEQCLQDAIAFLEGIPRPTELPDIQTLIPNWEEMRFTFAENAWPHGLFSRTSMKGWCVLSYKASGDLLINSEPVVTVVGVDPNICTTASIVYTLDQYFIAGTYPEIHLHRQLSYLDSIAATNKSVRSLLDDYEQAKADQAEQERMAAYYLQYPTKRKQRLQKQAADRAIVVPGWWYQKYPDDYEAPTVTRTKPTYCTHEPPQPQPPPPPRQPAPSPELDEFQKKAVANIKAMQDFIEQTAAGYEQLNNACNSTNPEPSTGTEDHDM